MIRRQVFMQLLESQQPHAREAWRKLNIQTAEKFRSKQLALEAAMLKRLQQQGGQTPAHPECTALEPWRALWPNIFVHMCEATQVIRKISPDMLTLSRLRAMSTADERPWEDVIKSTEAELATDIKRPGNECHTVHMVTKLLAWIRSEARPVRRPNHRISQKASPSPNYTEVDEKRVRCNRCGATVLKWTFRRHRSAQKCQQAVRPEQAGRLAPAKRPNGEEARPPSPPKKGRWNLKLCKYCGKMVCNMRQHMNTSLCLRERARSSNA